MNRITGMTQGMQGTMNTKKSTARPKRNHCGAFLCLLFFVTFLTGCAGTRQLPSAPPYTTAAELLHIVSTRYDTLRSLQTRAQITLKIDGIRENRATARLLYNTPDQLRIDIGTLGMSIMAGVANQNILEVFLRRDNTYLVGPPEKVLFALTGVNLTYYNLNHAVLGLPNLSPLDLPKVTRFDPQQNQVFLELDYPLWKRRLIFDSRTATLREDHIFNQDGKLISKRELSEYHLADGFLLPKHIAIYQGDDLITLDVKSHQSNIEIDHKKFEMRVPADVERYDIK